MRMRELIVLLCLSSWCLVIVVWLFLAVQRGCLQFVIVVFPYHTLTIFEIRFERVSRVFEVCLKYIYYNLSIKVFSAFCICLFQTDPKPHCIVYILIKR